jgi:hypothetical protein
LLAAKPQARHRVRVLAMLPKAAALYRQQIAEGLDGDLRAPSKARVILRQLVGGKITIG